MDMKKDAFPGVALTGCVAGCAGDRKAGDVDGTSVEQAVRAITAAMIKQTKVLSFMG